MPVRRDRFIARNGGFHPSAQNHPVDWLLFIMRRKFTAVLKICHLNNLSFDYNRYNFVIFNVKFFRDPV